jgi:hypothetical protein
MGLVRVVNCVGLAPILPVLLGLVLRASLLKGAQSRTSSNTPFTSLWLVLRVVDCVGLDLILRVLLGLVLRASLLKGARSHTSSNTPFTSLWQVLRLVYCMGLTPILPLLHRLLVHDCYYVQVTAWASLPNFKYYSVYWFTNSTTRKWDSLQVYYFQYFVYKFTTCTTCSLLNGIRSHTSSTTPIAGSWLVLCASFLYGPRSHNSSTTPFIGSRLVLRAN